MSTANDLEQIALLGLTQPREHVVLRPFQLLGHHAVKQSRRIILSIDKGLGKTIIDYLACEDLLVSRIVVCCTTNAYSTWEKEATKWETIYGDKVQIVEGTAFQRGIKWKNPTATVFVTNPVGFLNDCGGRTVKGVASDILVPGWVFKGGYALILDEFQRFLRNHGGRKKPNKFWTLLKKLPFDVFIPTSGSAVSKGPQDIWCVLNLLNPKKYPSYWQYVYQWCEVDDTGFGKVITGPKNTAAWRKWVAPDIFHRTKAMVSDQLPPKNRNFQDVQMEPWQKKLHDELRDQLWTETPDGTFIFAKNTLASIYKLRLALICPQAIHPSYGVGAGIASIADVCEESGIKRYVISTPFRGPVPYLRGYLESRGIKVWVLWGGIKKTEREAAIAAWSTGEGVIIQTIKYAQSYELVASPYGFMLGYEWDPEDNKQAEDRQNRLTSTEPTFIYYIRHPGAYDEQVIDILVEKGTNVRLLWGVFGKQLLRGNIDLTQIVGHETEDFAEGVFEDSDMPPDDQE